MILIKLTGQEALQTLIGFLQFQDSNQASVYSGQVCTTCPVLQTAVSKTATLKQLFSKNATFKTATL